jgi:hypothetical protein
MDDVDHLATFAEQCGHRIEGEYCLQRDMIG